MIAVNKKIYVNVTDEFTGVFANLFFQTQTRT